MQNGCFALAAATALMIGGAGLSVAQTAPAPREVLLGVSKGGRAADAASAEQVAGAMFEAAAADIRGGNMATGQRRLELLVARFPDSQSADRARRELAALYATAAADKPTAPSAQPSFLGRGEPAPAAAAAPISPWRTTVRVPSGFQKTAQDDLRASAGDLVFFSEGSDELGARARKALSAQAAWLAHNPGRSIIIEGHADHEGTADSQRQLSLARAEAVRARLIEEGVAAERIRVIGHGAEKRVAICADNSCAGQNRRVATTVGGAADANLSPR